MRGPGHRVEISDSIELCIVELTRVDCIYFLTKTALTTYVSTDG